MDTEMNTDMQTTGLATPIAPAQATPAPAAPAAETAAPAFSPAHFAVQEAVAPAATATAAPPERPEPSAAAVQGAFLLPPLLFLAALPWVLYGMRRKARKLRENLHAVVDPAHAHEKTLNDDIAEAIDLSPADVQALFGAIDHGTPLDRRIVAGIGQIDVVYRKLPGGRTERILEIATSGSGTRQIRRDTRTYDSDFLPGDVRESFIRTGKNEVAKLLYRKEG